MSVNQFAIEVANQLGFEVKSALPCSPTYKSLHNGQYYCIGVSYGKAADGSTGWLVTVYLRTGTRNFVIAETRGSLPRSGAEPTDSTLRALPHRRSQRHARILGLN